MKVVLVHFHISHLAQSNNRARNTQIRALIHFTTIGAQFSMSPIERDISFDVSATHSGIHDRKRQPHVGNRAMEHVLDKLPFQFQAIP
jgi:hypothetical protein